jgi:hypothetical protein
MAVARKQADQRIDAYLREMGVDRALLTEANAIPHQSVRFLRRDEIVRLGIDRREFGETGWHFTDKPRPTISKAYFIRSGNQGFPYRTAFLRMDCGVGKLMPLTAGIEMAEDETGTGASPFVVAVNGARVENGWSPEFSVRQPRFYMRTTNVTADMIAGVDDGGSIEIYSPNPAISAQSTVMLTMDGFSGAYATLRKTCDATQSAAAGCAAGGTTMQCLTFPSPGLVLSSPGATTRPSPSLTPSVNAGCPGGGTPPHCLILPPPGQPTRPLLPSQMTQPWNPR